MITNDYCVYIYICIHIDSALQPNSTGRVGLRQAVTAKQPSWRPENLRPMEFFNDGIVKYSKATWYYLWSIYGQFMVNLWSIYGHI